MMMMMMMPWREARTSWGWIDGKVWTQWGEAIAVHVAWCLGGSRL